MRWSLWSAALMAWRAKGCNLPECSRSPGLQTLHAPFQSTLNLISSLGPVDVATVEMLRFPWVEPWGLKFVGRNLWNRDFLGRNLWNRNPFRFNHWSPLWKCWRDHWFRYLRFSYSPRSLCDGPLKDGWSLPLTFPSELGHQKHTWNLWWCNRNRNRGYRNTGWCLIGGVLGAGNGGKSLGGVFGTGTGTTGIARDPLEAEPEADTLSPSLKSGNSSDLTSSGSPPDALEACCFATKASARSCCFFALLPPLVGFQPSSNFLGRLSPDPPPSIHLPAASKAGQATIDTKIRNKRNQDVRMQKCRTKRQRWPMQWSYGNSDAGGSVRLIT